MHVLILNQTFYPDVAATAQHMWDLARHLEVAGHDVTAITSRTVYGSTERFANAHERIGRINIHRVNQTSFGKRHTVGRMADFLSYYVTAFAKMQSLPAPDVIVSLTSPPMISLLGLLQSRVRQTSSGRRVAFVNYVMDLFPDAAVAMEVLKPKSMLTKLMRRLARASFDHCDAVIALGQDMKSRISNTYDVPHEKIHVVQPWIDSTEIFPRPRTPNALRAELGLSDDVCVVLYSGNLGAAHDVQTLISAIDRTRDDAHLHWCFTGSGTGMKQLKQWADQTSPPQLTLLPYQPRERLGELLALGDVHLVSQLPAFTGIVVPSKLFGIMAAGRASIFVGPDDSEVGRILIKHRAGDVVRPGDVDALLASVARYRNDISHRAATSDRARNALVNEFDCPIQCRRIEALLKHVCEQE